MATSLVGLVANGPGVPLPRVRLRVSDVQTNVLFKTYLQPPTGVTEVPQAVDPANLASLWSVPLDGRWITPGLWVSIQAFAANADPETAAPLATWTGPFPAGEFSSLRVVTVPDLEITLVPVVMGGLTGNVDTPPRKLEDWTERFRAMFPVARVTVLKGAPLLMNGTYPATREELFTTTLPDILSALENRRLQDGKGATALYYGVMESGSGERFGGMGEFPSGAANVNRVAAGGDWNGAFPGDNRNFAVVFAHEMGHTLGLQHADSAPPIIPLAGIDAAFPYAKADIGTFGFDAATGTIKAPGRFKDVMSYTPPLWISDYNYKIALYFLNRLKP